MQFKDLQTVAERSRQLWRCRRTTMNKSQWSWQQSRYHETYKGSRQYHKGMTGTWASPQSIKYESFAHDLSYAWIKNFDSKRLRQAGLVSMRCWWNWKENWGFWRGKFVCSWHPKMYFTANQCHTCAGCASKHKSHCCCGICTHCIWLKSSSKSRDLARQCCLLIITLSNPTEITQVGFAKVLVWCYQNFIPFGIVLRVPSTKILDCQKIDKLF